MHCIDCKFAFLDGPTAMRTFTCRRNPPVVCLYIESEIFGTNEYAPASFFPKVEWDSFCGEYKPAEAEGRDHE